MPADHHLRRPFDYESLLALAEQSDFPHFHPDGRLTPDVAAFLKQSYDDLSPEELAGQTVADVAAYLHAFWARMAEKPAAEQTVKLAPVLRSSGAPSGRDALEICGPDMPFLVDSVMSEVVAQGFEPISMLHPIVTVRRDGTGRRGDVGTDQRESYIQIQLDSVGADRADSLIAGVKAVLADVRTATGDFVRMQTALIDSGRELEAAPLRGALEEKNEALTFLGWLARGNFTFLGVRSYVYPQSEDGTLSREEPVVIDGTGLGLLADESVNVLRRGDEPMVLSDRAREYLNESEPLIVGKANLRARVHRRVVADYVGIKRYNTAGEVIGETRFVGLFTAEAYNEPTRAVPLLRRKAERVLERARLSPGSHSDKALRNIIENYPRDELFQISENELLDIALGILHLIDRPRPRLFFRRDRFDRFMSILAFVPRERYATHVREAIGETLRAAFAGRLSASYPFFGEGPLARVHYIIGLNPGHLQPDFDELEAKVAVLTRTWEDELAQALRQSGAAREVRHSVLDQHKSAFTAGYREAYSAQEALTDIAELDALDADPIGLRARAIAGPADGPATLRCKLYVKDRPLALSAVLPILENLGLYVQSETPFPVTRSSSRQSGAAQSYWLHAFEMRATAGAVTEAMRAAFEAAFRAVWSGATENDGFNALIFAVGLSWREAALLRTLAKYRQQSGLDPSQAVQEAALAAHPAITRAIVEAFQVKFDPDLALSVEERRTRLEAVLADIDQALVKVDRLDDDRVLRSLANVVRAAVRTSFYQQDAEGAPLERIAVKIVSADIDRLPNPRPYREIFVWSPIVDGVHLRFGPVARGGLRWSDRRDDFRTEVLSLVKAQKVKNAVIVPVGAKGCFFPKALPKAGAREEYQAAGVRAYQAFVRGLLDVTDNIIEDQIAPPPRCVRWDDDDPYLVVAADKGTATFSDIANGLSAERQFWLGDAFASGGGAGYDHKKMGITAKGAWEAVKRHFREIGKDIQAEPFSVIGVGDMSGDVFGNGMLLSRQIKLIAAFDHRDIFIDPDPQDLAAGFAERQRLFDLPRSSWQDYDKSLISAGGGVFSRQLKAIPLSAPMRRLTGLAGETATPTELMHALLKADAELLWFGGIGTFVKAASESHAQAGDKANDAVRIDAEELRARVIGEGANLGMTQAARIAFARRGGRLNTDAIDNSAGVDTSDHEVNIKILLRAAEKAGALANVDRNPLLERMTDDVAAHVLRHNYDQTLALTIAQQTADEDVAAQERLMAAMESASRLDRQVEGLPDSAAMRALELQGQGLTRPELAVLLAYAKLATFDGLIETGAIDEPAFAGRLKTYFPDECQPFEPQMQQHRLRREIIATVVSNEMINLGGPLFVQQVSERAPVGLPAIAKGFEGVRRVFRLPALLREVDALDAAIAAGKQTQLYASIVGFLRAATPQAARRLELANDSVSSFVARYQPGADALARVIQTAAPQALREEMRKSIADYAAQGVGAGLAEIIARLSLMGASFDLVDLGARHGWPIEATARVYFEVTETIGLDRLRLAAMGVSPRDPWEKQALRRFGDDLAAKQRALTDAAIRWAEANGRADSEKLSQPTGVWAESLVRSWLRHAGPAAGDALAASAKIGAEGEWSLAKLMLAGAAVSELTLTVD